MASPRGGRPCCIRAALSATSTRPGFWKRRRNALHRLKAHPRGSHVDLADGVWREVGDSGSRRGPPKPGPRGPPGACLSAVLTPPAQGPACQLLDPHAGSEDAPAPLAYSRRDRSPGDLPRHRPSHAPKPGSQVHPEDSRWPDSPGLLGTAAGGALVPPGADDVDMQPVEAGGPGVMEGDWGPLLPAAASLEPGRRAQGRARASRRSPRLGSERDRGHRRPLSKRKLELLLSEPAQRKRRRQHAV